MTAHTMDIVTQTRSSASVTVGGLETHVTLSQAPALITAQLRAPVSKVTANVTGCGQVRITF